MYKKVSTDMNFVEREKQVEKFWEDNQIFETPAATCTGLPPSPARFPQTVHAQTTVFVIVFHALL